ncbi:MAG: glycosyltransferase family 2 protein [Candidatus Hodarchaeota archaeon]
MVKLVKSPDNLEEKETLPKELYIIIPAKNEEEALAIILPEIIPSYTKNVLVVDNGSSDRTATISRKAGAKVIFEQRQGYGSACLAGIEYLSSLPKIPEYICFFDGDGQSCVKDIIRVARPVIIGRTNYCQGSRMKNKKSSLVLSSMARLANRFFGIILSTIWKQPISDLGPLRVITWNVLANLNMESTGYGWTIEMSVKLMKLGLTHSEIPVQYKPRIMGKSKISGNVKTALRAAFVMSLTLLSVMIFWRPTAGNKK